MRELSLEETSKISGGHVNGQNVPWALDGNAPNANSGTTTFTDGDLGAVSFSWGADGGVVTYSAMNGGFGGESSNSGWLPFGIDSSSGFGFAAVTGQALHELNGDFTWGITAGGGVYGYLGFSADPSGLSDWADMNTFFVGFGLANSATLSGTVDPFTVVGGLGYGLVVPVISGPVPLGD